MKTIFCYQPLKRCESYPRFSALGEMFSVRGVWSFFHPAFKINSKVERTSLGLKGTQILIICWFLPAGAANTVSIMSLMRICSTDVAIVWVCAGHALGVLKYVFLSSEGIKPGTRQAINLYMFCYSFVGFVCVQVCEYRSSLQLNIIVSGIYVGLPMLTPNYNYSMPNRSSLAMLALDCCIIIHYLEDIGWLSWCITSTLNSWGHEGQLS